MRSVEEWAGDALWEWLLTDPYPIKPGIETPSEHEVRERELLIQIIAKMMTAYAEQLERER